MTTAAAWKLQRAQWTFASAPAQRTPSPSLCELRSLDAAIAAVAQRRAEERAEAEREAAIRRLVLDKQRLLAEQQRRWAAERRLRREAWLDTAEEAEAEGQWRQLSGRAEAEEERRHQRRVFEEARERRRRAEEAAGKGRVAVSVGPPAVASAPAASPPSPPSPPLPRRSDAPTPLPSPTSDSPPPPPVIAAAVSAPSLPSPATATAPALLSIAAVAPPPPPFSSSAPESAPAPRRSHSSPSLPAPLSPPLVSAASSASALVSLPEPLPAPKAAFVSAPPSLPPPGTGAQAGEAEEEVDEAGGEAEEEEEAAVAFSRLPTRVQRPPAAVDGSTSAAAAPSLPVLHQQLPPQPRAVAARALAIPVSASQPPSVGLPTESGTESTLSQSPVPRVSAAMHRATLICLPPSSRHRSPAPSFPVCSPSVLSAVPSSVWLSPSPLPRLQPSLSATASAFASADSAVLLLLCAAVPGSVSVCCPSSDEGRRAADRRPPQRRRRPPARQSCGREHRRLPSSPYPQPRVRTAEMAATTMKEGTAAKKPQSLSTLPQSCLPPSPPPSRGR